MKSSARISVLALLALAAACGSDSAPIVPAPPPPPPPPPSSDAQHLLFVGNSLTYTWDIPALVSTLAVGAGFPAPARYTIAISDYALEDHWHDGVAQFALGDTPRYDVMIMQQGPSTLASSGVDLTKYVGMFATIAKNAGTRPAVYVVWPPKGGNLDAGIANHVAAASAAGAALYPVGQAWRSAWALDPAMPLYGDDNFHPSHHGAWLAALVIAAMIYDRPVTDFANLYPGEITALQEQRLRAAATAAIRDYGVR